MEAGRYTRNVFLWDLSSGKRGAWPYNIKPVFFTDNNRGKIHLKSILKHAETVLIEVKKRKWNIELEKQSKLRTNILFKSDFKLEDYVTYGAFSGTRIDSTLVAQIRCGYFPLRIEMGRSEEKQKPKDWKTVSFVIQVQKPNSSFSVYFTQIAETFSMMT